VDTRVERIVTTKLSISGCASIDNAEAPT